MCDQSSLGELIVRARQDPTAFGALFERYRPFLLLVAQQWIGHRLAKRCEPEDVVQDTFVEAQKAFPQFNGSTEPEFSAWIKRIHHHNLEDLVRKHVLAKNRSLDQEEPLLDPNGSASFAWKEPAADQTTPSQRLVKGEKSLRLASLLQALPELQREAVRLRHLEGWPVEKIAKELDRSVAATAGLLKRGLQALRERMSAESWF